MKPGRKEGIKDGKQESEGVRRNRRKNGWKKERTNKKEL